MLFSVPEPSTVVETVAGRDPGPVPGYEASDAFLECLVSEQQGPSHHTPQRCRHFLGADIGLGSMKRPLIPETGEAVPRVQSPGQETALGYSLFTDPLRVQKVTPRHSRESTSNLGWS